MIGERLQERDEHRPVAQALQLVVRRLRHLQDHLGGPRVADRRARVGVELVGKARRLAGTALDDELVAALRQAPDGLRDEGHTPFSGRGLAHDADLHGTSQSVAEKR